MKAARHATPAAPSSTPAVPLGPLHAALVSSALGLLEAVGEVSDSVEAAADAGETLEGDGAAADGLLSELDQARHELRELRGQACHLASLLTGEHPYAPLARQAARLGQLVLLAGPAAQREDRAEELRAKATAAFTDQTRPEP